MLPPSNQTPRKSGPPSTNRPNGLPTFQPTMSKLCPVEDHTTAQQPPATPFLRPNFPEPVPLRSPTANLTPTTRILTCFRTAEYLRATTSSTNTTTPGLLIELYALVTSSTRTGPIQHFAFADLFFPHRPPHLQGTCTTWQGSELYEDDTRSFLRATTEDAKMCRAIVRPKKVVTSEQGRSAGSSPLRQDLSVEGARSDCGGEETRRPFSIAAEVEVLNIWPAGWEDVQFVRGIVVA